MRLWLYFSESFFTNESVMYAGFKYKEFNFVDRPGGISRNRFVLKNV